MANSNSECEQTKATLIVKKIYWFTLLPVFSLAFGMFVAAWLIEATSGFAYMRIALWGYQLFFITLALILLGGFLRPIRPTKKQAVKLAVIASILTGLFAFGFIMLASLVIGMLEG